MNAFRSSGGDQPGRLSLTLWNERYAAPLEDAQRALGMVRHRAKEWGIDPHRIGVLGFSAGGHLAATLCNNWEKRTYDPVDDADRESCRPDFALLIYPAYLVTKDNKLAPELKVTSRTPCRRARA